MKIDREKLFLVVLLILLFSLNYNFLNGLLEDNFNYKEIIFVERVIDGDTVVVNGTSIRLLGINTPEKGEYLYTEAKEFLESIVMNKTLYLERHGQDKYYRDLGYLFSYSGENINVKMVENGYGNYYFYSGKDRYSEELVYAWNKCIEKEINLCERSENICSSCVGIETENNIINNCGFVCDIEGWEISVEGRSNFEFNGSLNSNEKMNFVLDLDNSGRSLFLRDSEGKLVDLGVY
jgi:hypothetical protein